MKYDNIVCTDVCTGGAEMTKTRVFKNGNSQAIRIPKDMRTDYKEYIIRKIGEVYIAFPESDPWAPARLAIGSLPEDFLVDRNQPGIDSLPEREEM